MLAEEVDAGKLALAAALQESQNLRGLIVEVSPCSPRQHSHAMHACMRASNPHVQAACIECPSCKTAVSDPGPHGSACGPCTAHHCGG